MCQSWRRCWRKQKRPQWMWGGAGSGALHTLRRTDVRLQTSVQGSHMELEQVCCLQYSIAAYKKLLTVRETLSVSVKSTYQFCLSSWTLRITKPPAALVHMVPPGPREQQREFIIRCVWLIFVLHCLQSKACLGYFRCTWVTFCTQTSTQRSVELPNQRTHPLAVEELTEVVIMCFLS